MSSVNSAESPALMLTETVSTKKVLNVFTSLLSVREDVVQKECSHLRPQRIRGQVDQCLEGRFRAHWSHTVQEQQVTQHLKCLCVEEKKKYVKTDEWSISCWHKIRAQSWKLRPLYILLKKAELYATLDRRFCHLKSYSREFVCRYRNSCYI